jgi:hypothetical protein
MNKKIMNFKVAFAVIFSIFLISIGFSIPTIEPEPVKIYDELDNSCDQYEDINENNPSLKSYFKLSVITPFGDVLSSKTKRFDGNLGSPEGPEKKIQIRYNSFYSSFSGGSYCGINKSTYCTVGGVYKTVTEVNLSIPSGSKTQTLVTGQVWEARGKDEPEAWHPYSYIATTLIETYSRSEERDLYYCPTTKDLYELVKIPSDWVDMNLSVYCNDGLQNGYSELENINFEFLSKAVNSYKVCIVKNQDLLDNNTIIYGLEYGLPTNLSNITPGDIIPNVRAKPETVFNITNMSGTLVEGLGEGTYKSINGNFTKISYNDEYILEYNNLTYEFALYNDGIGELNTSLMEYSNFSEIPSNLTRSIIVKKKEDGNKTIGYDISGAEMEIPSRLPIYYINNIGFNQNTTCMTHLGRYGAVIATDTVSSTIGCFNNGLIEINSFGFKVGEIRSNEPFNIYKNIIFGYK